MIRNMDVVRELLLFSEGKSKPDNYNVFRDFTEFFYEEVHYHGVLLNDQGYITLFSKSSDGFQIGILTSTGETVFELIKDPDEWQKIKRMIKEHKLPQTIDSIIKVSNATMG